MTFTSVKFFLDSNVLIYAVSTDSREANKMQIASGLIESDDYGLSTQVLQEFYVIATTKMKQRLSARDALAFIERLQRRPCAVIDLDVIRAAIRLQERYRISYWDAAILAAAHELKTRTVYTEDLGHGQFYGEVQVINPFVHARK